MNQSYLTEEKLQALKCLMPELIKSGCRIYGTLENLQEAAFQIKMAMLF